MTSLLTLKRTRMALAIAATTLFLTGCNGGGGSDSSNSNDSANNSSGETDTGDSAQSGLSYITLDAATDVTQAAYLDLAGGIQTTADQNWHVAYQKYVGFKVNGGASGAGNASGPVTACYTGNSAALYDAEGNPIQSAFEAATADSTLEAFNAVTSVADCTEAGMLADSIQPQIKDWLSADYSQGAPVYSADSDQWWVLRSATQDAVSQAFAYARFHITDLNIQLGEPTVRQLTLGVQHWNATSQSFDEEVPSPVLDYSEGRVYYDLESNSIVTADDDWELSVVVSGRDYLIQVNGGASGTGRAGIGTLQVGSALDVTNPEETDQVYKYFADQSAGALSEPGSYGALDYNIDDQGHQMWPNYGIYLVQDGEQLFKMQVLSNYGEDGTLTSGNLYIRYAPVAAQ